MNLVRRTSSPLPVLRSGSLEDQFGSIVENMLGDFFSPFTTGARPWQEQGTLSPRMDVNETEKTFEIKAEMPGVKKEDLKVSIDHDRVTIEGECRKATERREGENVVYSERAAGKFMRSFMLPTDVDDAAAQAKLEDGILSLTLPKKQASQARRLTIQ